MMPARQTAKRITWERLLSMFSKEVRPRIEAPEPRCTHIVVLEVLQMDSSAFGHRTALRVGPERTFTLDDVLDTPGYRLGTTPSQFHYPLYYAEFPGSITTTEQSGGL